MNSMNEDALKERIKVVVKERGIGFNEAWKQLLLERFLARLSKSKHQERFIFKGGLLLAQYLTIGRHTTDADFLVKRIKAESDTIEKSVKEITQEKVADGFSFSWGSIAELSQPHMRYPGFRVNLPVTFGKMKDKIQLDIGVGDTVEPVEEDFAPFKYKGKPIFEGKISLLVYPVESIFSEKIETIISKGATNSRMKDYHDALMIIREEGMLPISKLKKAMRATLDTRGTEWKSPIVFTDSELGKMQTLWNAHLRTLGLFKTKLNLPEDMKDVLKELNSWIKRELGDF